MKKIGVVGLGNMGMGIAKNLIKNEFDTTGFDLRDSCLKELKNSGGNVASSVEDIGKNCDVVFIMVMNGNQVKDVVAKLSPGLKNDGTIIVTATITPEEVRSAYEIAKKNNIKMIDSPVSGGLQGAHEGTLTLMSAADKNVFNNCKDILKSISKDIFHVGNNIGGWTNGKSITSSFYWCNIYCNF